MAKYFIKLFKLNTLKEYHDVTSLTDARWALQAYLKEKGAPLWGLKYCTLMQSRKMRNELCTMIDNIQRICEPDGMKNQAVLTETLDLIKQYDIDFRGMLLTNEKINHFVEGYEQFLYKQDMVKLQPNELVDAKLYIQQNMQAEIGLWTEAEVEEKLKNWRLSQMNQRPQVTIVGKIDLDPKTSVASEPTVKYGNQTKVALAKATVKSIKKLDDAKALLEKLADSGYEDILDTIIYLKI